jgi:hypothetical protein
MHGTHNVKFWILILERGLPIAMRFNRNKVNYVPYQSKILRVANILCVFRIIVTINIDSSLLCSTCMFCGHPVLNFFF